MNIVRAPRPEGNFYILDKRISEDRRLSWAARGLLVYLLGKPDHWKVSVQALINETRGARIKSGRDAVWALLKELMNVGYCQRVQLRNEDGTLGGMNYMISETASFAEPRTDYPGTVDPFTANPPLVSTDKKQELKKKKELRESAQAQAPTPTPAPAFPDLDVGMALDAAEEARTSAQAQEQAQPQASEPAPAPVPAELPTAGTSKAVEALSATAQHNALPAEQKPVKAPKPTLRGGAAIERPASVTAQTWADWLTLRKTKRAPVTPTVVAMAEKEAAKAGISLEDFLQIWCARGSQGLLAAWLKDETAPSRRAKPDSLANKVYVGGAL